MELLNFSQYQERSYEEIPTGKGWVNYGDDNLFPQYLVDLYKSSATHNALCTSIAFMIFGEGIQSDDLEANLKVKEWGLNDEIRKACLDLKIQGGYALEVIYSLDRTTISKVRHLPFENVRSGEVNDKEEVDFYYYSKDWSNPREEPIAVRSFSPDDSTEFPVQIMYIKPFSPGSFYTPKPDYIGSIDYIELDKEIAKYHINNIKNGLAPSYIINFKNGTPPPEERRKLRKDLEKQITGATNTGKFIMTFSDDPSRAPDFEPFPLSDADKQYQFLSEEVSSKIMVGHRVTSPQLFGVAVSGKLGGGAELSTAADIFKDDVIAPYRDIVVNSIESLLNASGISARVSLAVTTLEEASVEQSFTGIQISSAVDIISKVGLRELTVAQAVQLLVSMLGFSRENAEGMFVDMLPPPPNQEDVVEVEASQEDIMDAYNLALDSLVDSAEDEGEEWELFDARKVDYETEATQDAMWSFARVLDGGKPESKPSPVSNQDNALIKVRYAYMPKTTGGRTNKKTGEKYASREFCLKMVGAGNKVWAKEQIDLASTKAVNKGWGAGGASTYDIFLNCCDETCTKLYKGGGSCQHFWERRTYLRKGNKNISVNQARKIIRENGLEPLVRNDPKVAKRPRDMEGRGFIDGRGNWTTPQT